MSLATLERPASGDFGAAPDGDPRDAPLGSFGDLREEISSILTAMAVISFQICNVDEFAQEAINRIGALFQSISDRVRVNMRQAAECLGDTDAASGGRGRMEALCDTVRATLQGLLQQATRGARLSEESARQMEQVNATLSQAHALVRDVETIATKARLLALNAQIEAHRAGAHGQAFAVVAQETKQLAEHAAKTTNAIGGLLDRTSRQVSNSAKALVDRAATDRESAATAQGEVDRAMEVMAGTNTAMRDAVRSGMECNEALTKDLAATVVSLQFQDAMSQRIKHAANILDEMRARLRDAVHGEVTANETAVRDWVGRLEAQYTMESERYYHDPASTTPTNGGGSVELF